MSSDADWRGQSSATGREIVTAVLVQLDVPVSRSSCARALPELRVVSSTGLLPKKEVKLAARIASL